MLEKLGAGTLSRCGAQQFGPVWVGGGKVGGVGAISPCATFHPTPFFPLKEHGGKKFSLPYSSSAPARLLIYGGTSSGSLRPTLSFFLCASFSAGTFLHSSSSMRQGVARTMENTGFAASPPRILGGELRLAPEDAGRVHRRTPGGRSCSGLHATQHARSGSLGPRSLTARCSTPQRL